MTKRTTRALAACAITCLFLLAVAPLAGAAKNQQKGGTVDARLNVLEVDLTHVPVVVDVGAALGVATGDATTVGDSLASLILNGIRVGDKHIGSHSVSSENNTGPQEVTVPLDGPGIDGSLTIAKIAAAATADTATSTLSGLDGSLELETLGLTAFFGGQGIDNYVDAEVAKSTVGVDVGPIRLQLGDLLPAELLEALPLSVLLDLLRDLDLNIAGLVGEARAVLRQIEAQIDDIQATAEDLADAEADLDSLLGSNPGAQAAQQQVTTATAAVTTATATVSQRQSELDALNAQKAVVEQQLAACAVACGALQAQLTTLTGSVTAKQQEVAAAQAALVAAQSQLQAAQAALDAVLAGASDALKAANALVDQLQGVLNDLLDQLEDLLGNVPNLSQLIEDALDAFERRSPAGDRTPPGRGIGSDRRHRGQGEGSVFGGRREDPRKPGGRDPCADLRGRFNELTSGIFDLLSGLPVVGSLPRPTVDGLVTTESGTSAPDDEGRTAAAASITALQVAVPSIELEAVVDKLVADLVAQLTDLAASTPLAGTLDQVIDTVMQQLDDLPTGDLLDGLRTVGIRASAAGVRSTAAFATSDTEILGSPDSKQGPETLPLTGAGHLLAMLALGFWALIAGAAANLMPTLHKKND